MPLTPASSSTPYITVDEFLRRYDLRTIGDLVSDSETRLNQSQLQSSQALLDILADAAGEVESAALADGRYTKEDLAALTGVSLQFLKRLVSDLTLWYLYQRRPDRAGPIPPQAQDARNLIALLRSGDRIFVFTETQIAGRRMEIINETNSRITRNRVTRRAERHFGLLDNDC